MNEFGWFQPHEKERIFLPNEIFADLQKAIPYSAYVAFTYCYYWLACYLYRYCKYYSGEYGLVTQQDMKAFLGYPKSKRIDYIIRKGGILTSYGTQNPLLIILWFGVGM